MYKQSKSVGHLVDVNDRRTRADHQIKFACPPTTYVSTDKGAWWRGVAAWNKLNPETQKSETVEIYKRRIEFIKPPKPA